MVDYGTVIGIITALVTLIVSIERLLYRVNVTLVAITRVLSQIESAFADTGDQSGRSTSSVVSTEGIPLTPLDKGS